MNPWLVVAGSVLTIVIGLWKFFQGKAAARAKQADEGDALVKKGEKDADTSEIVAGLDDINNASK